MRALLAGLLVLAGAAHGAVIAEAGNESVRLALHDEAGPCVGAARLAVLSNNVERIPGCWVLTQGVVSVVFLDGTFAEVPMQAFRSPTRR